MYLARDIPAFVMYCVNGESGSSLLIESTDSMIGVLECQCDRAQAHTNALLRTFAIAHTRKCMPTPSNECKSVLAFAAWGIFGFDLKLPGSIYLKDTIVCVYLI